MNGLLKRWRALLAVLPNVADQAFSSATNVALLILVARRVSAADFGAFSLVIGLVVFLMATCRTFSVEPLLVRPRFADALDADAMALGTSALAGLAVGAVLAAIGLAVTGGPVPHLLLGVGPFIPGIFLQDSARYVFFARRDGWAATLIDGAWGLLIAVGWLAFPHLGIVGAVRLWGAAASVSAVAGVGWARVLPALDRTRVWCLATRTLGPLYLGEYLVSAGASQVAVLLLGPITSLAVVGAVLATQTILGPLNTLYAAAYLFVVPRAAERLDDDPTEKVKIAAGASAVMTIVAVVWTLVVVAVPGAVGAGLFGSTWHLAQGLLGYGGANAVLAAGAMGPLFALRAMRSARSGLVVRTAVLPVVVGLPLLAAFLVGARGFFVGMTLANAAETALWWVQLLRVKASKRLEGLIETPERPIREMA